MVIIGIGIGIIILIIVYLLTHKTNLLSQNNLNEDEDEDEEAFDDFLSSTCSDNRTFLHYSAINEPSWEGEGKGGGGGSLAGLVLGRMGAESRKEVGGAVDGGGYTAFHYAAIFGNVDLIKVFFFFSILLYSHKFISSLPLSRP